jgi:hypothetical protein
MAGDEKLSNLRPDSSDRFMSVSPMSCPLVQTLLLACSKKHQDALHGTLTASMNMQLKDLDTSNAALNCPLIV